MHEANTPGRQPTNINQEEERQERRNIHIFNQVSRSNNGYAQHVVVWHTANKRRQNNLNMRTCTLIVVATRHL